MFPKLETKMKEFDDCNIDDALLLARMPVLPALTLPVLTSVILPPPCFVRLMPTAPVPGLEVAFDVTTLALLARSMLPLLALNWMPEAPVAVVWIVEAASMSSTTLFEP